MWNSWCRARISQAAIKFFLFTRRNSGLTTQACMISMRSLYLNLPYLIPRLVRHFLPERLVRTLLLRNIIIRPGLETGNPFAAVQRYEEVLSKRSRSLQGKRVLVFGYGGRFDIGFGLLKAGASHVILCDKYAPPDEAHNRQMFGVEEKYFHAEKKGLRPRPEWMTLLEADIREIQAASQIEPVDIVLS